MLLVDTAVWIDHIHRPDQRLTRALNDRQVVQHPLVIGELSLGSIRNRADVLALLSGLPRSPVATHEEVSVLVEGSVLYGLGLSLVDAHLLASARLQPGLQIWTRDKRLRTVAQRLSVDHAE